MRSVYLNQLSRMQLQRYGERVGALTAMYGLSVLDTCACTHTLEPRALVFARAPFR